MKKKSKSIFMSRLAMGVLCALIAFYSIYHVLSLFSNDGVSTIISGVTTHEQTIDGKGYIFRDEQLLLSEYAGAIDYHVGDGEKIGKGQTIADIYDGDGTEIRPLLLELDSYIELLEKSEIGAEPLDLTTLRKNANDTYYTLVRLLSSSQSGELAAQIEKMMIILNKVSIMTDESASVSGVLKSIQTARAELMQGDFVTEKTATGGYFYYTPDGFEDMFSLSALESLTEDTFYELTEAYNRGDKLVNANIYGKLASNSSWQIVLPLSEKNAAALKAGESYTLTFSENNNTSLEMTLLNIIDAPQREEKLCVFYCNRLPNDFKLERVQDVEIVVSSVSGIYVPRSALTTLDGIRGVYVLRGSVVHFRKVEIIYTDADYCLVRPDAPEEGGYYSLGNNELIITEGNNLFDGRILEK